VQGARVEVPNGAADREKLCRALDDAFDYRGDVTLELEDGSVVDGFLFDRKPASTLEASVVRVLPRNSNERRVIPYSRIRAIAFSDKDPAAGKTWENWIKRYAEKKLKGEAAGIDSDPLE